MGGYMKRKWEKVASIDVDGSLCWVGEPYHLGSKTWIEFCDKFDSSENLIEKSRSAWAQTVVEPFGEGTGVCVTSGHGDGSYPVYVKRNSDGTIRAIKIKFDRDE
jgi:hypothetical protein